MPVTRGGVPADIGKYRKHLLEIAEAAEKRLYKKVQNEIAVLASESPQEIADVAREIQVEIDFSAIAAAESQVVQKRLLLLLAKLDKIIEQVIMRQEIWRESEDELIILMAIT